ncbi:hypothetical protein NMG60_11001531 [Bertholletia excelsa]
MSGHRRRLRLSTTAVSLGCSSSCRRPRLSAVFNPKPRRTLYHHSTSSSWDHYRHTADGYDTTTTATGTTFSGAAETASSWYSDSESDIRSMRAVQGFGRVGGESVAVEKDSDDPYVDFRRSMLQMIVEKEIYSKDDLRELLSCFLQLNSPDYHGVIVRAFTDIWNGVFSVKPHRGARRSRVF